MKGQTRQASGRANVIQMFDSFYDEHRLCGDIDVGVKPAAEHRRHIPDDVQWMAWMECAACKARLEVTEASR